MTLVMKWHAGAHVHWHSRPGPRTPDRTPGSCLQGGPTSAGSDLELHMTHPVVHHHTHHTHANWRGWNMRFERAPCNESAMLQYLLLWFSRSLSLSPSPYASFCTQMNLDEP